MEEILEQRWNGEYREIFDFLAGDLAGDPAQGGEETGAVLLHKVRQVRHTGQFIEERRGQILGFQHHRDSEHFLGQFHGTATVVDAASNISFISS